MAKSRQPYLIRIQRVVLRCNGFDRAGLVPRALSLRWTSALRTRPVAALSRFSPERTYGDGSLRNRLPTAVSLFRYLLCGRPTPHVQTVNLLARAVLRDDAPTDRLTAASRCTLPDDCLLGSRLVVGAHAEKRLCLRHCGHERACSDEQREGRDPQLHSEESLHGSPLLPESQNGRWHPRDHPEPLPTGRSKKEKRGTAEAVPLSGCSKIAKTSSDDSRRRRRRRNLRRTRHRRLRPNAPWPR